MVIEELLEHVLAALKVLESDYNLSARGAENLWGGGVPVPTEGGV